MNGDLSIALAVVGTAATAVGTAFGLKLTWKRDEVTKQAGIATTTGDSIARVMQGFSDLNTSLQNETDRQTARIARLEAQIDDLKLQVAHLQEQLRAALLSGRGPIAENP